MLKRAALAGAVVTVAILLALGGTGVWLPGDRTAELPLATDAYRVAPIVRRVLVEKVPATGSVHPVALVSVSSQVSGQIKEIYVDFNDLVKKDDPLALIDPLSFQIAVDMAKAELDLANASVLAHNATIDRLHTDLVALGHDRDAATATVDQARALVADAQADVARKQALTNLSSTVELQKAQTNLATAAAQLRAAIATERSREAAIQSGQASLRAAEAQLENIRAAARQRTAALRQATAELERTVIRAPVNGSVTVRSVEPGQTVAVSLQAPVLFTIAQDQRQMQVMATVSEADIGRIRLGQKLEFTVDAYPGRMFRGEIVQIRVQPHSVQNVVAYTVVANAQNADLLLLPGMTATSNIITNRTEPVLAVPSAALRFRPPGESRQGAPRIYVLDGNQAVPVEVTIGTNDSGFTEVRGDGLAEGVQVVTGLADMRRGAPDAARSGLLSFLR